MNNKTRDVVVTVWYFIIIIGMFLICLLKSPDDISISERRKLAQFPRLEWDKIVFGENADEEDSVDVGELLIQYTKDFEKYTQDQFPARDVFRKIKAFSVYNIFRQKDNNDIYIVDGQVAKYNDKLDEKLVKLWADKMNKLYTNYLEGMNVYYSVVPDKNYFIAEENGYPHIDYDKMMSILKENMNGEMNYIDVMNELNIDDYYTTDTHWRQENLSNIMNKFSSEMNFNIDNNYTQNVIDGFYGVYYGQSALPIDSEKMIYLTNSAINNAIVKILNEETFALEDTKIYDEENFKNNDPYDIFLDGAEALIVIENNEAKTDKELIIFRDSFGSSLSPLFVEGYKKVTIVDLRYIATPLLEEFVHFNGNEDVLIINCTDVINNSSTLMVY